MCTNQQIPELIREILKNNDVSEKDILIEAENYEGFLDEDFKDLEEGAKAIRRDLYDSTNVICMMDTENELDLDWSVNIPNALLWAYDQLIKAYHDKDVYKIAGSQLLLSVIRDKYLEKYYREHGISSYD